MSIEKLIIGFVGILMVSLLLLAFNTNPLGSPNPKSCTILQEDNYIPPECIKGYCPEYCHNYDGSLLIMTKEQR